ncbi:hypothetical protein EDB85DRAFT_2161766 [Lactarius pseudohatsudake]|nr:hypothetical protein EDB85DRAFT_2161766 [Lactarius pseudohatsudake]
MARRQRVEENDDPGPRRPKASRLTDTSPRPKRSNRGQGGVVARLVATAAQIRPDLEPQLAKQCKNTVTPADASVNAMAPAKKSRARVVTPTRNDPPLSLDTLKPSLLQGGPGSTFGFARVDPTDEAVGARGDADVDDREVAPHAMEDGPEPNIDEASPDEDERQAQQFLRSPTLHCNAIRSPEEDPHPQHDELIQPHSWESKVPVGEGQSSQSVLQVHQQKNGAIRPPDPDALLARAGQPLGGTSNTRDDVRDRTATSSEDDGDSSDDNRAPAPRSGRTFKPIELAKPTHLRFYSGIWRDVLIAAKTYNRLVIHAEGKLPFPERNRNGLRSAHGCILEAIGHLENGELARFDDPIYCTYKHDMIILVLNDGSTYRGRMKNVAREVVKKCFSKELEPRLDFGHNCEQEQQVISEAVQAIIRGSRFLRRPELDENQRTENFAHPAIIELCKRFYYSSKSDCLSNLFPDHFARLPVSALAMACTCISNCLSEWESGIQVPIQFTGRVYEPVYVAMMDLIKETMRNEYHGRKLLALLKRIAKEGREQNSARRSNTSTPSFTVNLD